MKINKGMEILMEREIAKELISEKQMLANEIGDFCLKYKIFSQQIEPSILKHRIESKLDDIEFVESVIHLIVTRTKQQPIEEEDFDELIELLTNLERIRTELDYKCFNKSEKDYANVI